MRSAENPELRDECEPSTTGGGTNSPQNMSKLGHPPVIPMLTGADCG
jgi:hypothetical protein